MSDACQFWVTIASRTQSYLFAVGFAEVCAGRKFSRAHTSAAVFPITNAMLRPSGDRLNPASPCRTSGVALLEFEIPAR